MIWTWKNEDIDESRFNRIAEIEPSKIDRDNLTAMFNGKNGVFCCTLASCECQDFRMRLRGKGPCKHILLLGVELGAYDPEKLKRYFEGKKVADQLSLAYGKYHLFHDPIMSNDDYDAMKREWSDILPKRQQTTKEVAEGESIDMDKADIVRLLKEHNIRYTDRMGNGGCFWIEKNEQSDKILAHITMDGMKLETASKSKALGDVPALYYRKR